jgi:hypothetical protein
MEVKLILRRVTAVDPQAAAFDDGGRLAQDFLQTLARLVRALIAFDRDGET